MRSATATQLVFVFQTRDHMSVKSSFSAPAAAANDEHLLPENEPPEHKRCRQAIRSFCLSCQGRLATAVKACADTNCPLHRYRLGLQGSPQATCAATSGLSSVAEVTASAVSCLPPRPLRAARCYCLVCTGNQRSEVRLCAAKTTCALWPFRFGVPRSVYLRGKARWRGPKQFSLPGLKLD